MNSFSLFQDYLSTRKTTWLLFFAFGVLIYSLFYFWVYGYTDFEIMIQDKSLETKKPQSPTLSTTLISDDSVVRWEKLPSTQAWHERDDAFVQIDSLQRQISLINIGLSKTQDATTRDSTLCDLIQLFQAISMRYEKIRHLERRLLVPASSAKNKQTSTVISNDSDFANEKLTEQDVPSINLMNARFSVYDEDDEQTIDADDAEYISGAMQLSGNRNALPTGNIFILVNNPDGDLMEDKEGDAGKFEFNGKKTDYSFKIKNVTLSESGAKVSFRFRSRDFEDGQYTVTVYGSGQLLGSFHFSLD
ncbi:MAG: hypothetical protein ACKO5C_00760 [Ferruginibacter sp.]